MSTTGRQTIAPAAATPVVGHYVVVKR